MFSKMGVADVQCLKCKKDIVVDDVKFCPYCGKKLALSQEKQKSPKRANGQGSAYKIANGWAASVVKYYYTDDSGKRKPKRVKKEGFRTKKEAMDYIQAMSGKGGKKVPTLNDFWVVWEADDLQTLSKTKQDSYKIAKKKLEDIFHTAIDQLTIEDLRSIVSSKAKTHYPAKDMKTLLSHLYKFAVAQGDVPTNLAEYIKLPSLDEKESVPFTKDEQNSFWELYADGDTFAPYVLLLIYTGMMPGELLAAKKSMVNWDEQKIVDGGMKTKKRKVTPIVLPDIILPVLRKIFEQSKGEKLIHIHKDTFYDKYYAFLERAGCRKLPPYSCRHTTGTALGTADIPLAVVKEIMRHTKLSTTEKYIHVDTSLMLEAVNKVQEKSADKAEVVGTERSA